MDRRHRLAQQSRDGHLTLRRVERQQALIERLHAARGRRLRLEELAAEFRVSTRTMARDVERLRLSGVPLTVQQGRGGGVSLPIWGAAPPVSLDIPEIAAVIASLTAVGPTSSQSAESAMRKLVRALDAGG